MNPQAIQQLQIQLGLPATGVFDAATQNAMQGAISKSISTNPTVTAYAGSNSPEAIANAYATGNWSGVVDLTGKPFTDDQQQAAVSQAETALAPEFNARVSKDTADTKDTLRSTQEGFHDFQVGERKSFGQDKTSLDQNAAEQGILFSGARTQKLNDLRSNYATREEQRRRTAADSIGSTTRNYQYTYGNDATKGLNDLYALPGATAYQPTAGTARPGGLSSVYNPNKYDFQGTAAVANKAAAQTRAAGLLTNRANKLTLSGVGARL